MRRILFTSGLLACVLAPTVLRAQPADAANTNRPTASAGQNQNIAGIALGGPVGVMTEEQRTFYQSTLRAMRGQFAELEAKLRTARQDVLNTSLSTKFDENLVREKALAAARFEAELAVLRAKALSQLQPPLSPEQIEKIKAGQPGPMRPFEHARRKNTPASTNHDENGLPPKQ